MSSNYLRFFSSTAAAAAIVALVTACGSPTDTAPDQTNKTTASTTSTAAEGSTHSSAATELDAAEARVAVATDSGVTLLNDDGTITATYPLPERASLTTAGDQRHVFATMTKRNAVSVLDGGVWTVDHGDHQHYYRAEPSLANKEIEGAKPIHVVANPVSGETSVYFDDDATATVLTADQLEKDALSEGARYTSPAPHHGAAVPLSNDTVLLSQSGRGLADTIALLDHDGTELDTFSCPKMHGEAVYGTTAAFGCSDSVLLVNGDTSTSIPSPDESGERVGGIVASHDGTSFLADWGETSLLLVRDGASSVHSTPVAYSNRIALPDGGFAYLGTDGVVRILDSSAEVRQEIPVTAEWTQPEGHGGISPSIAVTSSAAGTQIWVSEPEANVVHRVDLSSGSVSSIDVEGKPASIAGIGGTV